MNIYFLVEGKTEKKVYPQWLSWLAPHLERVTFPTDVTRNSYYLISGGGFPSILDNHLCSSVDDVNFIGKYDYLIIALDSDYLTAQEKFMEVDEYVREKSILLNNCELIIIPQVVCMETWFLGNRRIYTRTPSNSKNSFYSNHYNTAINDPELMQPPPSFPGTIGEFHYKFLKAMLSERNVRYSKTKPKEVGKEYYVNELLNRFHTDSNSLKSLQKFLGFLNAISN